MVKKTSHQLVNPFHPGEVLLEEFLLPGNVTQTEFAERLGWTRSKNALHIRRPLSPQCAPFDAIT
jgi:plasmid maintenance system antidote protein VapI